jgi:hypothetical protein
MLRMSRTAVVVAALAAATFAPVSGAKTTATALCVGPAAGCYAQLQPAVAAAADGGTITVAAGTYQGGVTIDKSLTVRGAGAQRTTIKGGGPVITIGRAVSPETMNVSIDGVTITGGVNRSAPDGAVTFGGGVWIPVAQLDHPPFNGTGATVSISNSVITGNQAASDQVIPPGFCGPLACGFNSGGGIDNGGKLTLTNVGVTNNTAGATATSPSIASSADSGGISNRFASTLVIRNSVVSGNRAVTNSPIAASAAAGGIGSLGALDIADSSISDNTVEYVGSTAFGDQAALAGGILLDRCCGFDHGATTIRNTRINGNVVHAVNTSADSGISGFGGGIVAFAPATLDRVSLTDNSVAVEGAGFVGGDGGGIEVDAPVTIRDGLVARNKVTVTGPGALVAFGGGIAMFEGDLTLERTQVIANSVTGNGAGGPLPWGPPSMVYGGGISNGGVGAPPGAVSLTDSVVTANRLAASAGIGVSGGGVLTDNGLSRTRTVIAGNKPDDCAGC